MSTLSLLLLRYRSNSKFLKLSCIRSSTWKLFLQRERAIAVYPGGCFPTERLGHLVEDVQATCGHLSAALAAERIMWKKTLIVPGLNQMYTHVSSASVLDEDANIAEDANMSYLTKALEDTMGHEALLTRQEVLPMQAKNSTYYSVICPGLFRYRMAPTT